MVILKNSILILLLTALLASTLVGCNNSPDEPAVSTTEDAWPYDPADANPASDFEYKTSDDGGITITEYIGTDIEVVIPEQIDGKDVTVIGSSSFAYQQGHLVVSVKMPSTVKTIETRAFEGCKQLTTVVLSPKLEEIRGGAFQECIRLSSITLPNTLCSIGASAFFNCSSLKHINIPQSVTEMKSEAFAGSGLETVDLEEGLAMIGSSAFMATPLKEVSIPGSIKTIPRNAFALCSDLEKVTLNTGLETIEGLAFTGVSKLVEITVPNTVTSVSELAFVKCDALQKVRFEGNAPSAFRIQEPDREVQYAESLPDYTVYYREGAEGFTSPEWNGYATIIW